MFKKDVNGNFTWADENGQSSESLAARLAGFLVTDILPSNTAVDWDYIRIELWLDSGRVIAFPAKRGLNKRIEKCAACVQSATFVDMYDRIEEGPEDEFEENLEKCERDIASQITGSLRTLNFAGASLAFHSADEKEPIEVVIL